MANEKPDHANAAVDRFVQGFNCAQAVCATLAPLAGIPEATALKIAAPFGGGMSRTGSVCGAVTGALMVVGAREGWTDATDQEARTRTYQLGREVMEEFKKRHGSIVCRDLMGCDISTTEGHQKAVEAGLFRSRCPLFVRDAAAIVGEALDAKKT